MSSAKRKRPSPASMKVPSTEHSKACNDILSLTQTGIFADQCARLPESSILS